MKMRTCREFPGTDQQTSERLARDVADDETAIVSAIRQLRREKSVSLETLAFLLGADAAHLSRHLNGTSITTLTNYLRIARAFGYRCRIILDKADHEETDADPLSNLRIAPRKVLRPRSMIAK
jgi:transcriptional regulator with XRE-family HTH domain